MNGQSTKSVLGTKKRTEIKTDHLSIFDTLDEQDARMIYQAYRLGILPDGWKTKSNLKPKEFIQSLDAFIQLNYDFNWSVRKDDQPLLILFAKDVAKFIFMGDAIWWPKTSNRQKLESVAAVLNEIRKSNVGLIEAEYQYKKFYERIADRKIIRRIGSLYDTIEKGSRTTFFQTRME